MGMILARRRRAREAQAAAEKATRLEGQRADGERELARVKAERAAKAAGDAELEQDRAEWARDVAPEMAPILTSQEADTLVQRALAAGMPLEQADELRARMAGWSARELEDFLAILEREESARVDVVDGGASSPELPIDLSAEDVETLEEEHAEPIESLPSVDAVPAEPAEPEPKTTGKKSKNKYRGA